MKKQLMRVVSANLFSRFFKATAIVLILSGSTYANAQVSQVAARFETPAAAKVGQVNHIGTENGMLIFEVKVPNVNGEKFRVVVKDVDGTLLYQDTYNEKGFSRKFMIPTPDSNKLMFQIKTSSGTVSQAFEINSHTRVVEDVQVTRVS